SGAEAADRRRALSPTVHHRPRPSTAGRLRTADHIRPAHLTLERVRHPLMRWESARAFCPPRLRTSALHFRAEGCFPAARTADNRHRPDTWRLIALGPRRGTSAPRL